MGEADVGAHVAVGRDRAEIDRLPGAQRRGGASHHPLGEDEMDGADQAAARISGAMIWWAEMPAAFIEMISLFWLSPTRVISAPSRPRRAGSGR